MLFLSFDENAQMVEIFDIKFRLPIGIPDIHIIFLLNFYFNNFPFGVDLCIFVSNASKTVGCLSPTFVAFVRGGGRVSGGIPSPPGYPIP